MFELLLGFALYALARPLARHRPRLALLPPAAFVAAEALALTLLTAATDLAPIPLYLIALALAALAALGASAALHALPPDPDAPPSPPPAPFAARHRLAPWLFLRALGAVYLVAFASLWTQLPGLIGSRGILPAAQTLDALRAFHHDDSLLTHAPSLALLDASDGALTLYCALGVLAAAALLLDLAPAVAAAACFTLYLSLFHAAQPFLGFQWDTLLLEAGFLAILLAPWRLRPALPLAHTTPTAPLAPHAALLFLLGRLMLASGLCKLTSGDPTWANLDALTFHYWTQPLPNALAPLAHALPAWVHRLSALQMFAIELLTPLLLLLPAPLRRAGALLALALMLLIAATGNYGFFNLLTAALALLALDDEALLRLLPGRLRPALPLPAPPPAPPRAHALLAAAIALPLLLPGLANLSFTLWRGPERLPAAEAIAAPLAPLHISNTYGLFATMTTRRDELIFEGSDDGGATWHVYRFPWKASSPDQPLPLAGPHMPRLDWHLWFAALGGPRRHPWALLLIRRLLEGSPDVLALLDHNPFPDHPPRLIRVTARPYTFNPPGSTHPWHAGPPRPWLPPLSLDMFEAP